MLNTHSVCSSVTHASHFLSGQLGNPPVWTTTIRTSSRPTNPDPHAPPEPGRHLSCIPDFPHRHSWGNVSRVPVLNNCTWSFTGGVWGERLLQHCSSEILKFSVSRLGKTIIPATFTPWPELLHNSANDTSVCPVAFTDSTLQNMANAARSD